MADDMDNLSLLVIRKLLPAVWNADLIHFLLKFFPLEMHPVIVFLPSERNKAVFVEYINHRFVFWSGKTGCSGGFFLGQGQWQVPRNALKTHFPHAFFGN